MKAVPAAGRIPRRGLLCGLAALVALGMLLATCTAVRHSRGTAGPAPTGPPSTSPAGTIHLDLRRYYTQDMRWRPCPDRSFQCTSLTVPRDYAHPRAGDISLAVIRRPATGRGAERIGALHVNPGGPGISAIDDLRAYADTYSPSLRAAYDLVAVDPRGVGHSTPVDCGAARPRTAATRGTHPPDRAAVIDTWAAYHAEVAADCARTAGGLLPHVGTLDAARDLDVVRAALDDEKLHFLGFSYGTYLGATYAELFPSRVGRMVLDGAVDPGMDGYHAYLNQARGYQTAWESFAADCARREHCPVGHSVKEAGRTLDTWVAALDRASVRRGEDDHLDGEALLGAVVTALRAPDWETLRGVLAGVRDGDLAALRKVVGSEDAAATGDASMTAVNCLSSALEARSTPGQTLAALPEFLRASPQFGAFYNEDLSTCAHWPARPTQVARRVSARGAGPILVIGTTRDPATPYDQARALADQLSSGRLLTWDGDGHTAYQRGSRCVDTAVDDYLLRGLLPPTGAVCR
ncbi:alpha/beta hydrolase [Actinacidiphila sp. bgisy167]|uniref:alpha/beta hydrolase n=1 Tax=Actinacidiphila sp. bgisy167 TaxID=3413797 RepID=UPI003D753734